MELGVAKSKAHFRTMLFASLFFLTCGMVLEGMHFLIKGEIQDAYIQWKLLEVCAELLVYKCQIFCDFSTKTTL